MSARRPAAARFVFGPAFARVAITDRAICERDLPARVLSLGGRVDAVIVRERDLTDEAYERLAAAVGAACARTGARLIVHGRPAVAARLGCRAVHLPLPQLAGEGRPEGFACVGTNVHELGEVDLAQGLGADYLIASPIFVPSCKPDAPARGIAFLADVVRAAAVPVLALGGMDDARERDAAAAGAAGACRMSGYMRG